jgi:Na+/H+ antiporter NhaD/arsenite permease-like protein
VADPGRYDAVSANDRSDDHRSRPALLRRLLLVIGFTPLALAVAAAPSQSASAASRTWPPFVLVVGLLLVGHVAHAEGTFDRAAALGALATSWSAPGTLMAAASRWETAAVGAAASVILNNLPAAVLLSARAPAHPRALLIGLNLGPNLAVTGSLSSLLWYRAARTVGSRPSLATVTKIGVIVVPLSVAAALVASVLFAPVHL